MNHWRVYRIAVIFYALAACAAVVETRNSERPNAEWLRPATEAMIRSAPDLPQNLYTRGLIALHSEDPVEARRLFEAAIRKKFYSSEGLLHNYALLLVRLEAPAQEIEDAVHLWRKHFPYSRNPDPRAY